MKKYRKIIYFAAAIFALSFTSCDGLLDMPDDSKIISGEGKFPTTQKDVESLLWGCYSGMRVPLNTEWMLTELRGDNSYQYAPNSTNTTNIELNELDMFRPLTTNVQVYNYWSSVYQNIKNANLVLKHTNLVTDSILMKQYEGEVRFIRAYHYYNLVQLFGPVPLVTDFVTTEEAKKINRSPVDDVYGQIIEDLKFAGNLSDEGEVLPDSYDDENLGRITSWAAQTLLAKVYLIQKRYGDAQQILLDIRDNSGHKLLDNYADVFSVVSEMTPETIFAIRYKADAADQGSPFANRFSPASSGDYYIVGDGNSFNFPSEDLITNGFEDGDIRKDFSIRIDGNKKFVTKYFSKVTMKENAENDWQVLRFSDVLLMLAETYNELEGAQKAIPLILQIRQRAGLDLDKTTLLITSQNECREAILNERRAEFAFENQRFYDLVRTGQLVSVINKQMLETERGWYSSYGNGTQGPTFSSLPEEKILLPIPQKEIDTSTEFILTQNSGY